MVDMLVLLSIMGEVHGSVLLVVDHSFSCHAFRMYFDNWYSNVMTYICTCNVSNEAHLGE
jgi:hypothetical protein